MPRPAMHACEPGMPGVLACTPGKPGVLACEGEPLGACCLPDGRCITATTEDQCLVELGGDRWIEGAQCGGGSGGGGGGCDQLVGDVLAGGPFHDVCGGPMRFNHFSSQIIAEWSPADFDDAQGALFYTLEGVSGAEHWQAPCEPAGADFAAGSGTILLRHRSQSGQAFYGQLVSVASTWAAGPCATQPFLLHGAIGRNNNLGAGLYRLLHEQVGPSDYFFRMPAYGLAVTRCFRAADVSSVAPGTPACGIIFPSRFLCNAGLAGALGIAADFQVGQELGDWNQAAALHPMLAFRENTPQQQLEVTLRITVDSVVRSDPAGNPVVNLICVPSLLYSSLWQPGQQPGPAAPVLTQEDYGPVAGWGTQMYGRRTFLKTVTVGPVFDPGQHAPNFALWMLHGAAGFYDDGRPCGGAGTRLVGPMRPMTVEVLDYRWL